MRQSEIAVLIFLWAIAVAVAAVMVVGGLKQIDRTIKSQPTCFPPYVQMNAGFCTQRVPTGRESPRDQRWSEKPRLPWSFDQRG